MATERQAARALAVLNQASRAHSSVEKALRRAISDHLATHWAAALEVAQETGDPVGRVLAEALDTHPQPAVASQIEAALPERTVALRELSVVATRQALEDVLKQPPSPERDARAAALLNKQSIRLSNLGRREQALVAIEEAVAICRQLAQARPDAFLPNLATSLNSQSNQLSELGRREQALVAIEEAVRLVLPLLERAPYVLPDSGVQLLQNYFDRCKTERERARQETHRADARGFLIGPRSLSR